MCLVEVEKCPQLTIACNQPVCEGMVVYTNSEKVKRAREIIIEFFLLNHPLDCPVCDKAGECTLQDYSFEYGASHSRYEEEKRVLQDKDLGPNITLRASRCIMCTRCVRFMDEIAGDKQLAVVNRGLHSEIAVSNHVPLEHPLAGNVVDICPVGSMLDKNFIHRTRVWHLESALSVCSECSAGCNIFIDSHNDEIFRIRPRANKEVNDQWICDIGRYSFKKYAGLKRLAAPKQRKNGTFSDIDWNTAIEIISKEFKKRSKTKKSVAGIISPAAVNEDAFAVMKYMETVCASEAVSGFFRKPLEKDREFKGGFVIKGDKLPNQQGLKFVLNMSKLDYETASILTEIDSGNIKAAYIIHTDFTEVSDTVIAALKKLDFLVVEDITLSPLAKIAHVVLPGKLSFEKSGTFINYQKRLQLLERAVQAPIGTRDTWEIMRELSAKTKKKLKWTSSGDIFLEMAERYPILSGLSHFKLDKTGFILKNMTSKKEFIEK